MNGQCGEFFKPQLEFAKDVSCLLCFSVFIWKTSCRIPSRIFLHQFPQEDAHSVTCVDLMRGSEAELQDLTLIRMVRASSRCGREVSSEKSKIMVNSHIHHTRTNRHQNDWPKTRRSGQISIIWELH